MITVALFLLQIASAQAAQAQDCSDAELKALSSALDLMQQGDEAAMVGTIEGSLRESSESCDRVRLSRVALLGWIEARKLAPAGGPVSLLGPVNERLKELRAITSPSLSLEVAYADATIRAAIAAAQDERPEMALLLEQARDLTERLSERGRRPVWPRPFNLLAGELWFEVDRYAEAVIAYERATRADGSAAAFAGLGRSLEALGRHDEACRAFTQVRDAALPLRSEVTAVLAGCP